MTGVIHVITTIERGGAEKQLLILAKSQFEAGKNVTIVPLKGKLDLLNEFIAVGAQVNIDLSGLGYLKQVMKFRKLAGHSKSIIHAHLPRAEMVVALSTKRNAFLISRHNSEPFYPGAPKLISIFLSRFVVSKAAGCIAISKTVLDFLIDSRELSKRSRAWVIYYGFEQTRTIQRSKSVGMNYPHDSRSLTFGTISRLVPQKDLPTLLQGFALFQAKNPGATLKIAGEGYLLDELSKMTHELGITNSVSFLGKIANIEQFLSTLDVFILTSVYEGFGMVLLEAMNANLPILASNISAIPEVLGKDHPGLVPVSSPWILAKFMESLKDNSLRKVNSNFGFTRLRSFEVQSMELKISHVYKFCRTN
jgi:glycosyltransferase involved in cell wall biosynthesis